MHVLVPEGIYENLGSRRLAGEINRMNYQPIRVWLHHHDIWLVLLYFVCSVAFPSFLLISTSINYQLQVWRSITWPPP